jgi:hypothetical protein
MGKELASTCQNSHIYKRGELSYPKFFSFAEVDSEGTP